MKQFLVTILSLIGGAFFMYQRGVKHQRKEVELVNKESLIKELKTNVKIHKRIDRRRTSGMFHVNKQLQEFIRED